MKYVDKSLRKNFLGRVYEESVPHSKSKHIANILYLHLMSGKGYWDTVPDIIKTIGMTEEEYKAEINKFLKFRMVTMGEEAYFGKLRNKVFLAPRPCIVSYLELLGFKKESEGFDYLAMAVLDGNKKREEDDVEDEKDICIKDASECYGVDMEVYAAEVEKCLNTVEETAGMSAGEGAYFIRNKLITPTAAIKEIFKENGLNPNFSAYRYLATMSKLMLLGDKVGRIYSLEAALLHGMEYYSVLTVCRAALSPGDAYEESYDGTTIFNFLRRVCCG